MLFYHDFLISTILVEWNNYNQRCDFESGHARDFPSLTHTEAPCLSMWQVYQRIFCHSWSIPKNIESFIYNILGTIKSSTFLSLCFEEPYEDCCNRAQGTNTLYCYSCERHLWL